MRKQLSFSVKDAGEENLYDPRSFSRCLGTPQELKFYALWKPKCVCDIAVTEYDPVIHIASIRVLKQARLVRYRREGKVVYYSIDDEYVKYIFDHVIF